MNWWGKLLGGAFGFMMAGPLGAMLGASIGHNFDKGLGGAGLGAGFDPGAQQRVQTVFFTALFSVMGHLAKADGKVTQDEIKAARDVMLQMNLNADMRKTAIDLFEQGKREDFQFDEVMAQFRTECHRRRNLMQMFVEILMHSAYADGVMHTAERAVLDEVCAQLGFSEHEVRHIEAMVLNARHFGGSQQGGAVTPAQALKEAYEIIGVESSASTAELKKAYRRLMSQHHPDKLVAKGLPEEMMKMAKEKTQEIQGAYEVIKKSRS